MASLGDLWDILDLIRGDNLLGDFVFLGEKKTKTTQTVETNRTFQQKFQHQGRRVCGSEASASLLEPTFTSTG